MGIKGLLSYCRENSRQCADTVDLVEVARIHDGITLLVDFYSFEHLIMDHFWKSISQLHHNYYLQFDGGEYTSQDAYVSKLVKDLKSLGIELIFYVDGAKGSSPDATKQKLETWKRRHKQDVQRQREIIDMCHGRFPLMDMSPETRMRSVLMEIQFMATLKDCGCIIHHIPAGEADHVIAQHLQTNEKAYAVISNDSDFCVFRGSAMICNEMFDINGDLQLGHPADLPEKPLRLMCNVLKADKIAHNLGFTDHSQMVELSILAGNDFTGPFLHGGVYQSLGFERHRSLQQQAAWIRANRFVENNPTFNNELRRNHEFQSAVNHSRQFYSLTYVKEDRSSHGFIHNLLWDGIEEGNFSPHVLGMHNGFYWRRMMIEDVTPRFPSSETALIQLRTYIYRMVLPKHKNQVTEHGRSPDRDYEYARIYASEDKIVQPINYIKSQEIFRNLKNFDRIMTHYEPGAFHKTWFDRYGRKNGFICYVLRYFLVLNWGYNLQVSESEFLALVAVVFGRLNERWYQQLSIRPSPRCVTIGNWFQNIYRHAYLFLGKLLFLTHEFPLPREIFSGSVWTAFYTCCSEQAWQDGLRQVPRDMLMRCQNDMDAVIKEKRHMLRYLTEHIFYFDDRY